MFTRNSIIQIRNPFISLIVPTAPLIQTIQVAPPGKCPGPSGPGAQGRVLLLQESHEGGPSYTHPSCLTPMTIRKVVGNLGSLPGSLRGIPSTVTFEGGRGKGICRQLPWAGGPSHAYTPMTPRKVQETWVPCRGSEEVSLSGYYLDPCFPPWLRGQALNHSREMWVQGTPCAGGREEGICLQLPPATHTDAFPFSSGNKPSPRWTTPPPARE